MRHSGRLAISFTSILLFVVVCAGQEPLKPPTKRSLGSAYLPLDHWAYPVVERGIAIGAIPNAFFGIRPWTRIAIAERLEDRRRNASHFTVDAESEQIVSVLEHEFAPELNVIEGDDVSDEQVTSLYTRVQGISSNPVRDSFHFGQTLVNDFGRPYGGGFNNVSGGSASADLGPFTISLRGEYQHAAGITAYSPQLEATLAKVDLTPAPIVPENTEQGHWVALDSYAGATWHSWELSLGKESLWWGPATGSSTIFTDNIEPMFMGRFDRTIPMRVPLISRIFGPARMDFFMARMDGHLYPAKPWIHGEKVSFMPTPNFEMGFTRTTVWTGVGRGFDLNRLLRTYLSVGDNPHSNASTNDPGDRRGGFDVRYKVPGLRNWLTVYFDSMTDDDPSPLAHPNRAAFHPGFYLSHFPGLPKLEIRGEGAYTILPTEPNATGHFFYWNIVYHDSYTNKAMLIGDWVGREGAGGQLTATYWMTPMRSVGLYYRRHEVATDFLPRGGRQDDYAIQGSYHVAGSLFITPLIQYEDYNFPILAPGTKSDVTISVGLTLYPGTSRKQTP